MTFTIIIIKHKTAEKIYKVSWKVKMYKGKIYKYNAKKIHTQSSSSKKKKKEEEEKKNVNYKCQKRFMFFNCYCFCYTEILLQHTTPYKRRKIYRVLFGNLYLGMNVLSYVKCYKISLMIH